MNLEDVSLSFFVIIQFLRVPFNRMVYNDLHPKNKVPFFFHMRSSSIVNEKERDKILESDFYFFYFLFVFFWIKIPKSFLGKIYAFLVLGLSITQGILLYILIYKL